MTDEAPTAVILAAGEGRRLEPLTNRRPKPMLPVGNRPLLEHVIEAVAAAGVDEIVLVVGYERDRIQTHFGDGDDWDISIQYAIQKTQLGTAHAVQQAEQYIDGPFLVLNGDRIIDPSIVADVRDTLQTSQLAGAIAVTRTAEPSAYGVVTLSGDHVVEIVEKPQSASPSEIINAGVYAFTPAVFDAIRAIEPGPDGEYGLTSAIGRLAEDGTVQAVRYDGQWLDVSYLWDLLSVTGQLLDSEGGTTLGTLEKGAQVSDAAHIAETASIGPNAIVGRGTTVAENARIGPNATVKRSVVFPDVTVGAGVVLKDCVVSENATVGPNATVPGGEATIVIEGEVHEDVTFGGVVGDNAHVGGGAILAPGAILGDNVVIGEGAVASGSVKQGVEIRRG